jgi:hypothetical protein
VHELDTRDPRADHNEVLRNDLWWVSLTRDQDAIAVDISPLGDPRRRASGKKYCVCLESDHREVAVVASHLDFVRPDEVATSPDESHALAFELAFSR